MNLGEQETGRAERPGSATMLARAARLRCPLCGARGLMASWFRARERCAGCGLRSDRDESDFFIGAYLLNFIVAEVVFAALLAGIVVIAWPDVPWDALFAVGVAGMVLVPLLFFPFSRTVWLALDLCFQPPRASDFSGDDDADPRGEPPRR